MQRVSSPTMSLLGDKTLAAVLRESMHQLQLRVQARNASSLPPLHESFFATPSTSDYLSLNVPKPPWTSLKVMTSRSILRQAKYLIGPMGATIKPALCRILF